MWDGVARAGPRRVSSLGRLIFWRTFKPIFFKNLFNIYLVGAGKNLYLHLERYVRSLVWDPELTGNIFPIYSSDILAPLIV
jgi:hypothetical protein